MERYPFQIAVNTTLSAISFNPPGGELYNSSDNAIKPFKKLVDAYPDTCNNVSNSDFVNIAFELSSGKTTIKGTVFIKGSQECRASNTVWFVSERVPGPKVMECQVTESRDTDLRMCNVLCLCPCGDACGFLHLRVQNRPWMKETLSLCHFEQYLYM